MRIAVSDHFSSDLHVVRATWTLPELIEAHVVLDYFEELQKIEKTEADATRRKLTKKGRR